MFINKIKKLILPFLNKRQNLSIREKKESNREKGFTLIEVIVTLLLVGILAALGGMGVVQAVKGYVAVKENSETTQKAQMAMSRITREIIEMNDINGSATNTVLTVKNISQWDASNNLIGDRTIGLDGNANAIKIAFGSNSLANGDILIDNISSLNFTYYSGNSTWTPGSNINQLSAIDVSMTLIKPNLTFTTRVAPRNNGNLGGANMPTVTPPIGPNYCFVATAAYGDSSHPMVQILREFRDKYLLSFSSGRWFVKQYYNHGPAFADMIRNRPVAMWAVRCLLAPFVAIAFCLMYAPAAIPFVFLVSLIVTIAVFSASRRKFKLSSGVLRNRGNILVGLIITIVIMAVLAAAMLPMFSSSYMNQVFADQGRKAYFLAESGFNYASSEYLNAKTDSAKNAKLSEINGKTCNLLHNEGSFTIKVYPLWTVSETLSGSNLPSVVYGTLPDELKTSATGGYLKIGSNYYSYSIRTNPTSSTVTFGGISPTTGLVSGQEIRPVALPYGSAGITTIITQGGNLTLDGTGADVFPRLNGNFTVNGTGNIYNYTKKEGNILKNITLSDKTKTWSNFTVTSGAITTAATSKIVLDKFVRIKSTGTIGGASRTVTYNAPVGILSAGGKWEKKQDDDLPNDINNWTALSGSFGGHHEVIASPDGGNALHVHDATTTGWWTTNRWAVSVFKGYSNTNLAKSWLDAGGFLSYDIQVKVYNTQPYYFAGINLRTRNNATNTDLYTYGVSFVRGRQYGDICACWCSDWCWYGCCGWSHGCSNWHESWAGLDQDDIDNNLVPNALFSSSNEDNAIIDCINYYRYSKPAIVFWKRNSSGSTVIAYRELVAADGVLDNSSPNFRLKPWATLMARIAEGYSLTFTNGNTGTPIKEGDTVTSSGSSGWSARVVMTPILNSSCSWTSGSACSGTLVLANITGTSPSGSLRVNGTNLASIGSYSSTKKNYIKVYYSNNAAGGSGDGIETTNARVGNQRDTVNWPPDDITELTSGATGNDYMTLVTWTDYSQAQTGSTSTVIVDGDLTTPNATSTSTVYDFSGDAPAVVTSSGNATSTYYDDFAIQMDMSYGTGFLTPIQQ